MQCFNPHPPLLAGDAEAAKIEWEYSQVSIHTRHYWRVMPTRLFLTPLQVGVSIHTRHYWRVMRGQVFGLGDTLALFQSTPAITGG